jgi:hypothetical protein
MLLWSDIPYDVIMKYDEVSNTVGVFRKPAGYTNGLARDRQGRLIASEHLGRRISRTEYDGTVVTLVDRFEGKRLNSPNDVVVRSDNSICSPIRPSASAETKKAAPRPPSCRIASTASIRPAGRSPSRQKACGLPMASPSRPTRRSSTSSRRRRRRTG